MKFLGYPIEIWAASLIAVIVKLQTSNRLSLIGVISTVIVAMGSSLLLYIPVCDMMGYGSDAHVIVAVLIALTAENLMKAVVEFTADRKIMNGVIKHLIKKD